MPVEPNAERSEIQQRAEMLKHASQSDHPVYAAVVLERAIDRLTAAVEGLTKAFAEAQHDEGTRDSGH